MKENSHFSELIVSYLLNELNEEEEAFVQQWINSSEENKKIFEEIRKTWRLLSLSKADKDCDLDVEWHQFKAAVSKGEEASFAINDLKSESDNREDTQAGKRSKLIRYCMSTAVAASVILLVLFAGKLYKNSAERPVLAVDEKQHNKIASLLHHEVNNSGNLRNIMLADGSRVALFPGSELIFDSVFREHKRDITLLGKARFKVFKDKSRPFTVYSGPISTTALGTEFTVTAFDDDKNITVRLYEGKVSIQSAPIAAKKLHTNFILLPGQEFIYDNAQLTGRVRSFKTSNLNTDNIVKKEKTAIDSPSVPNAGQGSWYMFNNQPLSEVFDQLQIMYNVDIVYSKQDISKINFIGTFNMLDSLDNILRKIALLNDLKVSKAGNKIVISK